MDREQQLLQIIGDRIALARHEYEQHLKSSRRKAWRARLLRIRTLSVLAAVAMFTTATQNTAQPVPTTCIHHLLEYSARNRSPRGVDTSTSLSLPQAAHTVFFDTARQIE